MGPTEASIRVLGKVSGRTLAEASPNRSGEWIVSGLAWAGRPDRFATRADAEIAIRDAFGRDAGKSIR